jgi:hypothetical protein
MGCLNQGGGGDDHCFVVVVEPSLKRVTVSASASPISLGPVVGEALMQ